MLFAGSQYSGDAAHYTLVSKRAIFPYSHKLQGLEYLDYLYGGL